MRRRFATLDVFTETRYVGNPLAVVLARLDGGSQPRKIVLEEKIGPVACDVTPTSADLGRATFSIPKLPVQGRALSDVAAVAAALSLAATDIGFDNHAP